MKTAAFITARRADADVEVKTAVEDDTVVFDVPANGRSHPRVVLSFAVDDVREALDTLAPSPAAADNPSGRALDHLAQKRAAGQAAVSPQA